MKNAKGQTRTHAAPRGSHFTNAAEAREMMARLNYLVEVKGMSKARAALDAAQSRSDSYFNETRKRNGHTRVWFLNNVRAYMSGMDYTGPVAGPEPEVERHYRTLPAPWAAAAQVEDQDQDQVEEPAVDAPGYAERLGLNEPVASDGLDAFREILLEGLAEVERVQGTRPRWMRDAYQVWIDRTWAIINDTQE